MNGDELARWLGESGELANRYAEAIKRHVSTMASRNLYLREENDRLRKDLRFIEAEALLVMAGDCCDPPGIAGLIHDEAVSALAREDRFRAATEAARDAQ